VMTGIGGADMDRSDEGLEKLFKTLDADGSGNVSRSEMDTAIARLYGPIDPKLVDKMMIAADTDGDGEISLSEFKVIMLAGPEKTKAPDVPYVTEVGTAMSGGFNSLSAPIMGPLGSAVGLVPGMNGAMGAVTEFGAPVIGPLDQTFETMGVEVGFQNVMTGLGGANMDRSDAGLEKLFASIDIDSSGNISRTEMIDAIVKAYGKPLERKTMDKMFAKADVDGDGEISLAEFKQIMRAGPEKEKAKMPLSEVGVAMSGAYKSFSGPVMGPMNTMIDLVPGASGAMGAVNKFGAPVTGPLDQVFDTMGVEVGFQNVMTGLGGANMDRSEAGLEKFFKSLDEDNSGKISRAEMATATTKLYGKPLEAHVLDKMMKAADTDGDGEISLSEFKVIMKAGPRKEKETLPFMGQMGSAVSGGFSSISQPIMGPVASSMEMVPGATGTMSAMHKYSAPLTRNFDKSMATVGVDVGFAGMFALGGASPDLSDAGLSKLFKELDCDGSGNISRAEMDAAITRLYGKPLEAHVLDKMMKAADTDGDGEISLQEFKVIMRAGPAKDGTPVPMLDDVMGVMSTGMKTVTGPAMGPISSVTGPANGAFNGTIDIVPGMSDAMASVNEFVDPVTGSIDQSFELAGVEGMGFASVMTGLGGANMDRSDEGLTKFFAELDADGSGNISRAEMETAITKMYGKPVPSDLVDKMMKAADTDGDGEISLQEFKTIMKAGPRKDKEMAPYMNEVGGVFSSGFGTVSGPLMGQLSSTVEIVPGMGSAMGAANQMAAPFTGPLDKTFSTMGVEIGFQTVMAGMGGPNVDKSDAGLEKMFSELDEDASGNISRAEMEAAITKMYGKPLESHIIDKMMGAADTDNDGEISLDEFKTIMRAAPDKVAAEKSSIPMIGDVAPMMTSLAGPAMDPINMTMGEVKSQVPGMNGLVGGVEKMGAPVMGPLDKTFDTFGVNIGFQNVMSGIGGADVDLSDEGLKKLFKSLDADGSGNISKTEMTEAITKAYGKPLEPKMVDEMMKAADTDNDGEISLDEFKIIMRAGPAKKTAPILVPKAIPGTEGDTPAGMPSDALGYVAEGASLFGSQYDYKKFPLTPELKAKGISEEDWANICKSLKSGKGYTGFGGGFSKSIAKANEDKFMKCGCVAAYAEYGPGQKAMVVLDMATAGGGRIKY